MAPGDTTIYKLQKKSVRVISHKAFISHSSPLFKNLRILKLPDIYSLSLLKLYYKYENGLLPTPLLNISLNKNRNFHSYPTRHRNDLTAPTHRYSIFRKSIRYVLVNFVNSLDSDIRDKIHTHSLQNIIHRFRTLIIDTYETDCTLPFCYVCLNYPG